MAIFARYLQHCLLLAIDLLFQSTYSTTFQTQVPAPSYDKNPLQGGHVLQRKKIACRRFAPLPKYFLFKILLRIVTLKELMSRYELILLLQMCYLVCCLIHLSPDSYFGLWHWNRQPSSAAMNATAYGTKQEAV